MKEGILGLLPSWKGFFLKKIHLSEWFLLIYPNGYDSGQFKQGFKAKLAMNRNTEIDPGWIVPNPLCSPILLKRTPGPPHPPSLSSGQAFLGTLGSLTRETQTKRAFQEGVPVVAPDSVVHFGLSFINKGAIWEPYRLYKASRQNVSV